MLEQIQEHLNQFSSLSKTSTPKKGWIKSIREALGIPRSILANQLGCSRNNIAAIEQREKKGTISLETLEKVAKAMNCKLVYCLVPLKPLDKQLKDQARFLAKKRIMRINHSMKLEQQGLTPKQLQKQEDDLIQELLQGNPKNLWVDDEI